MVGRSGSHLDGSDPKDPTPVKGNNKRCGAAVFRRFSGWVLLLLLCLVIFFVQTMRCSTHLQQMEAHERDSIFTRHVYMRMYVLFRSVRQHKLCNFWIPFISPSIAGWVLLYDEKTAGRLTSAFSRWVMRFCAQIIARYPANIISIAPLRDSKTQPVNGKDRKKNVGPGLSTYVATELCFVR